MSAVTAICLNMDGSLVATASEKGQVIRIFKTENGLKVQELRRGTDKAIILGIAFDPVSKWISCSSVTGTIHVFGVRKDLHLASRTETGDAPVNDLVAMNTVNANGFYSTPKLTDNPKSMFSFLKPLFPQYFMSEFSFAQFRIQDMYSLSAIRDKYIIAITLDGNYYMAEINTDEGGECKMISHRALVQEN